jgi:tripartite-type tricarboxylate transporter receptor subunit TctC
MLHRIKVSVLLTSLLLTGGNSALAQTFPTPNRSITIVVGFPAGGAHDIMGRALAQELTKELGTSVIIENRPGAGGAVSVQTVARAEPDGHTLLFNNLSELAVRQAAAKVPYDLDRDLVPISLVGVTPIVLVVHNSVPVQTLAEFKAFARSRPEAVIYGIPGVGTMQHFAGEALRVKLDVPMKPLTYRGGAPLANDLAGGHVTVGMSGLPPLLPLLQAGTVRLIATSSFERSKLTPDVASFTEAGVGGVDIANYVGLAAPKTTPTTVLQKLEAATLAACKSPTLEATFKHSVSSVIGSTAAEYKAFIDRERAQHRELIHATNFKISE